MVSTTLYATALTALLGVAVFLALARIRPWRDYEPASAGGGSAVARTASNLAGNTNVWILGFVLAAAAVGFGGMLYAGSDIVSIDQSTLNTVVIGGLAGLLGLYLFAGTYYAMRERGGPSARAAAVGIILLGFAVLAVISLQLLGMI